MPQNFDTGQQNRITQAPLITPQENFNNLVEVNLGEDVKSCKSFERRCQFLH